MTPKRFQEAVGSTGFFLFLFGVGAYDPRLAFIVGGLMLFCGALFGLTRK